MTDLRDMPDAIDRWRAMIDALEATVLADPGEPKADSEIDAAVAEEIRHLITLRLVAQQRSTLPAAWVRRPGDRDLGHRGS
jgi:hypothetical protein